MRFWVDQYFPAEQDAQLIPDHEGGGLVWPGIRADEFQLPIPMNPALQVQSDCDARIV